MPKRYLTIEEIIKKSKRIDPKHFAAVRTLRSERRKLGRDRGGYNLATPAERRRVSVGATPENDSRRIQLRSSIGIPVEPIPQSPKRDR